MPQSEGSANAAVDSLLKYDKIYVGFNDKSYRVINLSLSVLEIILNAVLLGS